MRSVVLKAFPGFTADLEGATTWMYLDVLGIVTTGYGNALMTVAAALALPWRHADGSLATPAEVVAEYSAVQNLKGKLDARGRLWTQDGGGIFAQLTKLRLDDAGVTNLVQRTIAADDEALRKRHSDWDVWPGCAQMALLSLEWACGTNYKFPKMDAALAVGDFAAAAREIEMTKEHNPGNDLRARNAANEILMLNASRVQAFGLDPDYLNWTTSLAALEQDAIPTERELPPCDSGEG